MPAERLESGSLHPRPAPRGCTRFVIVGMPRSGTMLLVDALNQHSDVLCCHELFHPDSACRQYFDLVGAIYREGDAAAFLKNHIYTAAHLRKFAAIGFKLLYDQGTDTNVWDFLAAEKNIVIVRAVRNNPLECLASGMTAVHTGRWYTSTAPRGPERSIAVSTDECRAYLERHERLSAAAARRLAGHEIHDVDYRDLASSFYETVNRVAGALGLRQFRPVMRLQKLARRPLAARIANFAELARHFRGTRFGEYF